MTRQGTFKYFAFILSAFIVMGAPGLIQAGCLSGATPVGYWQLNEADGSTTFDDFSATDGNGTCTDCPVEDTDGKLSSAQLFNGSGEVIDVSSNTAYDFASGSFSVEVWVKSSTTITGNNRVIVGRDDDGSDVSWWIGLKSGTNAGAAAFSVRDADVSNDGGSSTQINGTTVLTDGEWHHIVGVRDGGANKNSLYVDGVLAASTDVTLDDGFAGAGNDDVVTIGNFPGSGFNFPGSIDEVAIYDAALTSAIIKQHALNIDQSAGYCDDLTPQILTTSTDAALGAELFWTVESAGNPFPTFALGSDAPLGMEIDTNSGVISWPPLDTASSAAFDCTASNGVGSPDTQQLTINLVDLCSSANLKGFWKLDEASGATNFDDFSAVDSNGTCTNCPSEDVDGQLGNAQAFDGSNDEISISANDAYDFTSGSFSIEVWIKTETTPGGNVVVVGSNGGNTTWWVGVNSSGNAGFNLRDSRGSTNRLELYGATDLTTSPAAWHHIVAVRDASVGTDGTNYLYVDGVLEATGSYSFNGEFNTDAAVNIGSFGGGSFFTGSADEVAIYDRAMTATMVSQHFMLAQSYCNTKPVIDAISAGPATEDSEFTFTLSATDADGDVDFLWSLTDAPTGMTVAETTGVVTWTPTSETTSGEVTATVADSVGGTDTETFTIAVTNVNDAPVISTTGPTTATVGTEYTYDADATDEDAGDTQTWSKVSGPDDLAIDSASGLVTWTPTSDDSATTNVTIRVTDGDGLSDTEDIVITVSGGSSSSGGGGSSGCFIGSLK